MQFLNELVASPRIGSLCFEFRVTRCAFGTAVSKRPSSRISGQEWPLQTII